MTHLTVDEQKITAFCRKHRVTKFALFGSVVRDDFRPDSDVDVLVAFAADATPTLLDLVRMEEELATLFGRKVDLLTWHGVEQSRNPIRRHAILDSAQVIYDAAA
ncbi:MAG: nucleotidyltransferase family protein [Armatimonadota bacterium]